MKVTSTVRIPSETFVRLAAAAREDDVTVVRLAGLVVEAAARLWLADRTTTAMPGKAPPPATAEVGLTLSSVAITALADAAIAHGLSLEAQIGSALAAGVADVEAAGVSGGGGRPLHAGGVPRRPPFDPRRYVKSPALGAPSAPRPRASVTAMLMGDPGSGLSVTAAAAGRQADHV